MESATDKLMQENKNVQGHGFCLVRVYDTKGKTESLINVKVQGEELVMVFDASNEEDVTTQFKVKRATKEFAKLLFDRVKVVFKDGSLQLDFDWSGIKRIQLEAAARAEKLAETKRKNEEDRVAREKKAEEARLAEEKKKQAEEAKRKEEERRARDAEELRKKKEEEERRKEENARKKAFEDKIMGAVLGAGAMPKKTSPSDVKHGDEVEGWTRTWSEECKEYYYQNDETFDITWRHPQTQSAWEKSYSREENKFYYTNKQTQEIVWEAPWSNRFEKIWVPDRNMYLYCNIATGDTQEEEPFY